MEAYITRDQLCAKPKPTFEPGAGFHLTCLMFARCSLDRVNGVLSCVAWTVHSERMKRQLIQLKSVDFRLFCTSDVKD